MENRVQEAGFRAQRNGMKKYRGRQLQYESSRLVSESTAWKPREDVWIFSGIYGILQESLGRRRAAVDGRSLEAIKLVEMSAAVDKADKVVFGFAWQGREFRIVDFVP